jgi:hypothetical protein
MYTPIWRVAHSQRPDISEQALSAALDAALGRI